MHYLPDDCSTCRPRCKLSESVRRGGHLEVGLNENELWRIGNERPSFIDSVVCGKWSAWDSDIDGENLPGALDSWASGDRATFGIDLLTTYLMLPAAPTRWLKSEWDVSLKLDESCCWCNENVSLALLRSVVSPSDERSWDSVCVTRSWNPLLSLLVWQLECCCWL